MKRSIKHLPRRTQQELGTLLELVEHYTPQRAMVVLYGSYARGGYVLWDEHYENGVRVSYQSDYDIMIVVPKANIKYTEDRLRDKVTPKYHHAFEGRRHTSPQFIVECIDTLNEALERKQYFFTDIIREGIKLYDSGEYKLAKPRELSFKEIKEFAQFEYDIFYPDGITFLDNGHFNFEKEKYKVGSFVLHQSCERFYNAICLVFTNYRPKCHKLNELGAMVKEYSRDLSAVFPCRDEFETRCYDLLCRAYIEARYNGFFEVTKDELEYMLERTAVLRDITERICTAKIASYDAMI